MASIWWEQDTAYLLQCSVAAKEENRWLHEWMKVKLNAQTQLHTEELKV